MGGLRVATYNLYLGADLSLVFGLNDEAELQSRLAEVIEQLVVTAFPRRAPGIAATITAWAPDVLALQEVTRWEAGGELWWDFLPLLVEELARAGTPYEVVECLDTFSGSGVVQGERPTRFSLTGANVLLRRADSPWRVHAVGSGLFDEAHHLHTVPGTEVSIVRGWVGAHLTSPEGRRAAVVGTHTEAYDAQSRNRQRDELFAAVAGFRDGLPAVVAGDLNATPDTVGIPDPWIDAWTVAGDGAGATCGQAADLRNETSLLSDRIDYVAVDGPQVRAARLCGHRPEDRYDGLWPSDHAGVVVDLEVP